MDGGKMMKATFKNISFLSFIMEGTEEFFKVYSKVPLEERKHVVVILDGEPINWSLAYQLIKNRTEKGKRILILLKELEII